MAWDREQARPSLSGAAEQVIDAVEGATAHAQIAELQQQRAQRHSPVQALPERLEQAVAITPDKQEQFATVAQAVAVRLSVARRRVRVSAGPRSTPRGPTLGRATRAPGQRAGPVPAVLAAAARPRVEQVAADAIVGGGSRS